MGDGRQDRWPRWRSSRRRQQNHQHFPWALYLELNILIDTVHSEKNILCISKNVLWVHVKALHQCYFMIGSRLTKSPNRKGSCSLTNIAILKSWSNSFCSPGSARFFQALCVWAINWGLNNLLGCLACTRFHGFHEPQIVMLADMIFEILLICNSD